MRIDPINEPSLFHKTSALRVATSAAVYRCLCRRKSGAEAAHNHERNHVIQQAFEASQTVLRRQNENSNLSRSQMGSLKDVIIYFR